jgi:hypothetical protein
MKKSPRSIFLAVGGAVLICSTYILVGPKSTPGVNFDWDSSIGFRKAAISRPPISRGVTAVLLAMHDRLVALQAKAFIARELRKSGWKQVTGEITVFVSEPLPVVLGVDRGGEWQINDPTITPLMEASRDGDSARVQDLLKTGADPNIRDQRGYTGLVHAIKNAKCNSEVAKMLLAAGATVNTTDAAGRTPLLWAVSCPEIAKELLSAGADVNWKDPYGNTPLLNAVAVGGGDQGALTMVKVLVAAGADVNARNGQGTTALELAQRTGQSQIAEFLKQRAPP